MSGCRIGAILNIKMKSDQIIGGALQRSDGPSLRTGIGCHAQDHYAITVAAIAAACFVAFPSFSSQVIASSPGA